MNYTVVMSMTSVISTTRFPLVADLWGKFTGCLQLTILIPTFERQIQQE